MRVRIEHIREERRVAIGWFAGKRIPAYCIYMTIAFGEEAAHLLGHLGLGHRMFFQTPVPPEIVNPEEIARLKDEGFGLLRVEHLKDFSRRTLLGAWPDLPAADAAEIELRRAFDRLADDIASGAGRRDSIVDFEP